MGGVIYFYLHTTPHHPHHTHRLVMMSRTVEQMSRGKGCGRMHDQQEQREGEGTVESMGSWPERRSWKREGGGFTYHIAPPFTPHHTTPHHPHCSPAKPCSR